MEYIVHHRCRGISASGRRINIPYGMKFDTIGNFIATADGEAICYPSSEMAHKYFARNDDGLGLERGKLTYAIAYSQRTRYGGGNSKRRQRFTDGEITALQQYWPQFLVPDVSVILFNTAFFHAELPELLELAAQIHVKV